MRPNTAMPGTQLIPHDTTTMPSTTQEGLRADNTANTDPNVPLEAVGALPTTTTLWEAAVPALYPLRLASFLVQDVAGYPRTRSNRGLVGEMRPRGMQIIRPSPSHLSLCCSCLAGSVPSVGHLQYLCSAGTEKATADDPPIHKVSISPTENPMPRTRLDFKF